MLTMIMYARNIWTANATVLWRSATKEASDFFAIRSRPYLLRHK